MAKKRHRRRKGFHGLGSVIVTRPKMYGVPRGFRGLGRVGGEVTEALLPIAVGGGSAGLATIGLRAFVNPLAGKTQELLYKYAPWVGLGVGGLAAVAMNVMAGRNKFLPTFTSAFSVSGLIALMEMMQSRGTITPGVAPAAGLFGAVVPEYSRPFAGLPSSGLGAIVMEPTASRGYGSGALGSYGEEVNLGAINPSAFGTPGFSV